MYIGIRNVIAASGLAFALSACVDAEVSVDFGPGDVATATMIFAMERSMMEMSGETPEEMCEDGEYTLDDTTFTCTVVESLTVDELIARSKEASDPDSPFGDGSMTFERVAADEIIGRMSLAEMFDEAGMDDEEMPAEMMGMFRMMFADNAIVVQMSGREIIETNGTVSDDGRTARLEIPFIAMLEGDDSYPEEFFVRLRY